MNPFDNQEQQQKNEIEKTKIYSLTLHCAQIKELTLIFDLLSKKIKYHYINTSLCLSSLHSCQNNLNGADFWCHCYIHHPSWTPPTFPHCAVVMSCLWMEMFAICPSAASPVDHECTVCQIFFHSFWLPKNETYFGSSPQQAKLTVNGSLKPHGSLSSILISQKTWDGSTSQSRALHTGNTCLQWTDYKRALPEGKQNSWPGCL